MKFIANISIVFILMLLAIQPGCSQSEEEEDDGATMPNGYQQDLVSAVTSPLHVKDAFPKDFSAKSNKRVILNVQSRISSMEHSLNGLSQGMEAIKSKTGEMESSLSEQQTLLKKLDEGFGDMERVLSTHKEVLEEVMDQIGPNDHTFALSNNTCGGVLFASSGSIIYSKPGQTNADIVNPQYRPLHCVWTIQAGHHSQIGIKLHDLKLPAHLKMYAVELILNSPLQPTRTILLAPNIPHVLHGPVAFIVLTRNSSNMDPSTYGTRDTAVQVLLEYEGKGKVENKRTQFFHHQLPAFNGSGSFSDSDLETWRDKGLESYFHYDGNYGYNFTRNFGTVVLSNFTTRVIFKLELNGGTRCTNDGSFIVVSDLLKNGTLLTDLCKTNSSRWKDGVTIYGTPVAFLIGKGSDESFGVRLPFTVRWHAESPYPSSSRWRPGQKCGGILGGTGGTISFQTTSSIRTSRCVWVIAPQPEMTSTIAINNIRYGRGYSSKPSLKLVELKVDGTGLAESINATVTDLTSYSIYYRGGVKIPVTGREVYIIYQTDSSSAFVSLDWTVAGEAVKTGSDVDVTKGYTWLYDTNGSIISSQVGGNTPFPRLYQVFILIQPPRPSSTTSTILPNMKLVLRQGSPADVDERNCLGQNVAVYTLLQYEILEQSKSSCDNPGNVTIDSTTGIAVIVINLQNQTNSNITLDYEWSQDFGAQVKANCGGVIEAKSGFINYKLGEKYAGNERCIWLLHTPNCARIRLTLVRTGFHGNRYLIANTIDPESGSLKNDSVFFYTGTIRHTFSEEFLVLLFQTVNGPTDGTGFSIQYSGFQCGNRKASPIHYHLQHYGSSDRDFSVRPSLIPRGGQHGPENDIYVIAYSEPLGSYTDVLTTSTVIDFNHGNFFQTNNNSSCTYDSIKFYGGKENDATLFQGSGGTVWEERLSYPERSEEGSTCPQRLEVPRSYNAFRSIYPAFLAVYKVGSATEEDGTITGEVEFSVRKVNNTNSANQPSSTTEFPFHRYSRRKISTRGRDHTYDWLPRRLITTTKTPIVPTLPRHFAVSDSEQDSDSEQGSDSDWQF